MNAISYGLPASLLLFSLCVPVQAQKGTCQGMSLGKNVSLNGFVPFPATDPWRQDMTNATVDGNSDAILATIGTTLKLHPNFASDIESGSYVGIPYQVVSGQALVPVTYDAYGDQSDPGPMPIPADALIEGYPHPAGSDRHVLVLDRDNCFLYELFSTFINRETGKVKAASGAIFDLNANSARPYLWTSSDAAGLPVFPGLARYDEVKTGAIHHALRFTLPQTVAAIVPPAKHYAANSSEEYGPPMGMRLRLRANFDISGFTPQAKIILQALKTYGMILADNGGGAMFVTGAPDHHWDNDDLHGLTGVTAADFEVLEEQPLYTESTVPTGPAPEVESFTAATTLAGTQLSWTSTGASYFIISPTVGAVRGNTVTIPTPAVTTTYTLYATNEYGRTKKTVEVTIP